MSGKKKLFAALLCALALCLLCAGAGAVDPTWTDGTGVIWSYSTVNLPSGKAKITACTIPEGVTEVRIPKTINGILVVTIGTSVFEGKTALQSVTIPDSVTSIGDSAFENCTSLQSLAIPDSVTSIGNSAFYKCTGLESVRIPAHLSVMGVSIFSGCSALQSVTIPAGVTSIGDKAFENCSVLSSVRIPGCVASIGDFAFSGCKGLSSVTIPAGVTRIGRKAFENCSGFSTIIVPGSVTQIGRDAFIGCNRLKDVYYAGTGAEWNDVTQYSTVLPDDDVLHTYDDQTDFVTVELDGLSADDRVTLTDGWGTKKNVNASGDWGFWNKKAKITITPGPGRRFSYGIGTVATGGGVTNTEMNGGGTAAAGETVTLSLDPDGGKPYLSVSFTEAAAEGNRYLHASVEKPEGLAGNPEWTFACGSETYTNGSMINYGSSGAIGEKTYTLTLIIPKGCGCVGSLYSYGKELILVTEAHKTYTITTNEDVWLTLSWYDKAGVCSVTYDGNGSSAGTTPAQLVKKEGSVTAAENGFEYFKQEKIDMTHMEWKACRFTGWNTQPNGRGTPYQPNDSINNISADLTLYAQWEEALRVLLMPNGGEGKDFSLWIAKSDPDDPDYTPKAFLPESGFTKAGAVLSGWNTKRDGTGTPYELGGEIELTDHIDLYAQWADAYSVTFEPNFDGGEPYAKTVEAGESLPVPDGSAFSLPFRTFMGWNTERDGTGTGYSVGGDPILPTDDMTLWAQWEWTPFAVTCVDCSVLENGAAVTQAKPGTRLTLLPQALEGMTLSEWEITPDTVLVSENTFVMPVDEVNVKAVYRAEYEVTVSASPEEGGTVTGGGTYDKETEVTVSAKPNPGYRFLNWTDGAGEVSRDAEYSFTVAAERTLTANFEELPPFDKEHVNFIIPAGSIGANAFAGDEAIAIVDASHCTSLGEHAFRDCRGLTQILLPADCVFPASAVEGCEALIAIYAPGGGPTQASAEAAGIPFMPVGEEGEE